MIHLLPNIYASKNLTKTISLPESAQENPNTAKLSCQQSQNNTSSSSLFDFNENYKSVYENRNPLLINTKTKNDTESGFFPIKRSSLEKLSDQNNNSIGVSGGGACSTKIRNKKRIVKVRSDSRPISALYDIICKEKEICGPVDAVAAAAASASLSNLSPSCSDFTTDIMSSVETKQQPASSSHHLSHQPPKLKYYQHRTSPSNGNFVENLENLPVASGSASRFAGRLAKGEKRRHTDGNVQGTLFKLSTAKSAGSECDIISNEIHSLALSHSVNARSVDAVVPTTTGKR